MATQNFQRNLLLHLYQDGEKKTAALFGLLLPLKREKKTSDTCSLFSLSGDPWPSCLLRCQLHATLTKLRVEETGSVLLLLRK